jgi:hypothetical protein
LASQKLGQKIAIDLARKMWEFDKFWKPTNQTCTHQIYNRLSTEGYHV